MGISPTTDLARSAKSSRDFSQRTAQQPTSEHTTSLTDVRSVEHAWFYCDQRHRRAAFLFVQQCGRDAASNSALRRVSALGVWEFHLQRISRAARSPVAIFLKGRHNSQRANIQHHP